MASTTTADLALVPVDSDTRLRLLAIEVPGWDRATLVVRAERRIAPHPTARDSIGGPAPADWRPGPEVRVTPEQVEGWGPGTPYHAILSAARPRIEAEQARLRREAEARADADTLRVDVVSLTGGATWQVSVTDSLGRERLYDSPRVARRADEGGSHPHRHLAGIEAHAIYERIAGPKVMRAR